MDNSFHAMIYSNCLLITHKLYNDQKCLLLCVHWKVEVNKWKIQACSLMIRFRLFILLSWYFTDNETGGCRLRTCHLCLDGQLGLCQRLACKYNYSKFWFKHSSIWYIVLADCHPYLYMYQGIFHRKQLLFIKVKSTYIMYRY